MEHVGAERYRVTCIKMHKNGHRKVFILDKNGGITRGFTPQEIEQRMPEMRRLHRRGENLYYTPLSADKHHILIDDMNREKLDRLVREGYRPATVLESSVGNYQAIITIKKLGTPHDRQVGNRLSDALNREYGDPKLSGCIHPHRAPAFENRKPRRQRPDGSYPEVQLITSRRRECFKTLALSRRINTEHERQAASGSAIDAYQRHYRDRSNMGLSRFRAGYLRAYSAIKETDGENGDRMSLEHMSAFRREICRIFPANGKLCHIPYDCTAAF